MRMGSMRAGFRGPILRWMCVLAVFCPRAWAQAPPPFLAPVVRLSDGPVVPVQAESSFITGVEERLRAAEDANRTLTERLDQLRREHRDETSQLERRLDELSRRLTDRQLNASRDRVTAAESPPDDAGATPFGGDAPEAVPGDDVPDYVDLDEISPFAIPQQAIFGPGFQLQSVDKAFSLQIHYESQIEARIWSEPDQLPANSGFFLPRQRIFFNGNISQPVEYEVAINRGVNNINLLNAFLNFRFDDRFQVRVGRFVTPLLYDQFAISNYWMPTPERSLFTTNLGLNRQIGAMVWGDLFDKRLDYAAGVFNGSRNSFESLTNDLDCLGYLNARPFQNTGLPRAQDWNVGASVAFGRQDQTPVPTSFRVGAGSPDANIPGVATIPFLVLDQTVREQGDRLIGSVHTAYYYRSLSLIGEWQFGYADYAHSGQSSAQRVPFSGFYATAGYFLTGEQIQRRTRLTPLRPLVPLSKDDERGPGAWEAVARVSQLRLGDEFFTAGFADPTRWSSTAVTTELGANWYWNDYLKFYLFWLHADFADPVQYRPGGLQNSADMFWLRGQLYF